MVPTKHETGFLVLHLGGSGAIGAPPLRELWEADGSQFPMWQVLIDTDKANDHYKEEGIVDASIPVRLDYDEIETVKATPGSFGPTVPRIVEQVAAMLDPEEMENGARTVRACAQLPWEVLRPRIADKLNQCIRSFLRDSGCKRIIPIGACSSGGGTGSSFGILLAAALQDSSFRSRVLQGFPNGLLRTLMLFVVEPFEATTPASGASALSSASTDGSRFISARCVKSCTEHMACLMREVRQQGSISTSMRKW